MMTLAPIPLRDAAYDHTDELRKLKNLALQTRRNYSGSYHTLAAFLEPELGREPLTSDLNLTNLERYFGEHVATHAPGAWAMRRSTFIAIVKWLMKKDYLPWGHNFAEDIPLRKQDAKRKRERRLSDEEFLRLLKAALKSHKRDYFLILFLRLTGRRFSEVAGTIDGGNAMTWGDVRWEENTVLWDNHKARRYGLSMPLTPRVRAVLEAWKEIYCASLGVSDVRNDWYIFPALTATGPTRKGHPRKRVLSPTFRLTNGNRVIRSLLEQSGLWQGKGDGWHILRKTFGNQRKQAASNAGRGDAWEMAKISLDHASEATTRVYVNIHEDYERYAAWAMEAEEMSYEAMAEIPELSPLAQTAMAAQTAKSQPAGASEEDARATAPVYTDEPELAAVVSLTSRRRLRAVTS